MPRTYSDKFMSELHSIPQENITLGNELAKLCVKANLPMTYVAKVLGVSKLTIFHWFRGRQIRDSHTRKVHSFMALIDRDLDAGVLPAYNNVNAKVYIQHVLGHDI